MEVTFKDVDYHDIPFLTHQIEDGLKSAPPGWYTWDKMDAVLGMLEAIVVSLKAWVRPYLGSFDAGPLLALGSIERLLTSVGEALYERVSPLRALKPCLEIVDQIKSVWNYMDMKGWTGEYSR